VNNKNVFTFPENKEKKVGIGSIDDNLGYQMKDFNSATLLKEIEQNEEKMEKKVEIAELATIPEIELVTIEEQDTSSS